MIPWLLNYAVIAAALAAVLALFLTLKRELHGQAARHRRQLEAIVRAIGESREATAEAAPPAPSAASRSAWNLTTRVQAVRMARRNLDVSHIAAALGVTRSEVELLLRVHKTAG